MDACRTSEPQTPSAGCRADLAIAARLADGLGGHVAALEQLETRGQVLADAAIRGELRTRATGPPGALLSASR